MTRAERSVLQEELGLDLPLWEQYVNWLERIVRGDVTSFYGFSATENLKIVLPPSVFIYNSDSSVTFDLP